MAPMSSKQHRQQTKGMSAVELIAMSTAAVALTTAVSPPFHVPAIKNPNLLDVAHKVTTVIDSVVEFVNFIVSFLS